eukprot:6842076-Pyramimonas_sp.AAC.1
MARQFLRAWSPPPPAHCLPQAHHHLDCVACPEGCRVEVTPPPELATAQVQPSLCAHGGRSCAATGRQPPTVQLAVRVVRDRVSAHPAGRGPSLVDRVQPARSAKRSCSSESALMCSPPRAGGVPAEVPGQQGLAE